MSVPKATPDRVVVFIDYQNLLNDARRAFFKPPFGPADGQVDPVRYARRVASRIPLGETGKARVLKEVRVYRGRPDPRREPQTYAAHMRQCDAWERSGATVIPRPLRYPRAWPQQRAEEKGIDVQVAIDMVVQAANGELDVAILASTDTDLRPALEAFHILPLADSPLVEVVAWRAPGFSKKLQIAGRHVWAHFLDRPDYNAVRDTTDYNIRT